MKVIKYVPGVLFVLISMLLSKQSDAQHKTNTWFRIAIDQSFNHRWKTSYELHHRRQSSIQHENPLQSSLLFAVRPWVHYSLNHSIQISASPLAYYHQFPLLIKGETPGTQHINELRSTVGLSVYHPVGKRFSLKERTLWEYRSFDNDVQSIRSRFKLGIEFKVHPSWYITLHEETMVNVHHSEKPMHFDQERINLNIRKIMNKHVEVEMEWAHIIRNMNNDMHHLKESNLLLHLNFKI
ncbi:MAG TPA: DUF2490 domain-containing protein [Ferruginibacter sp.]|nr:DUF2490 domain-containing protein [Ferruginibacter sp.]HRO17545.1 DUF2490 domain-containing protein [Ferruginibacter sp.]HRQ20692.1 DUF2490 domain-containing protein [Ferruginibacter sp.]